MSKFKFVKLAIRVVRICHNLNSFSTREKFNYYFNFDKDINDKY